MSKTGSYICRGNLDIEHSDENALRIFERKVIRKIYSPVCGDGV
jgi:hypothetical protein